MKTLTEKLYNEELEAISLFTGDPVIVIGEATLLNEEGVELGCYLYNHKYFKPENGKPFVGIKENIMLTER